LRRHPRGRFLGLQNVTATWRPRPGHRLAELGLADAVDALPGTPAIPGDDGALWLPPFAALPLIPAH